MTFKLAWAPHQLVWSVSTPQLQRPHTWQLAMSQPLHRPSTVGKGSHQAPPLTSPFASPRRIPLGHCLLHLLYLTQCVWKFLPAYPCVCCHSSGPVALRISCRPGHCAELTAPPHHPYSSLALTRRKSAPSFPPSDLLPARFIRELLHNMVYPYILEQHEIRSNVESYL
jgi:hypothetical protein